MARHLTPGSVHARSGSTEAKADFTAGHSLNHFQTALLPLEKQHLYTVHMHPQVTIQPMQCDQTPLLCQNPTSSYEGSPQSELPPFQCPRLCSLRRDYLFQGTVRTVPTTGKFAQG